MENDELYNIIQPLKSAKYTCALHWNWIDRWIEQQSEDGGFNDSPEYQRGHVWTEAQQISFIEAVLRGIIPDSLLSIRLNNPTFDDSVLSAWCNHKQWLSELPREVQVIDGEQRLQTIRKFMHNKLAVFDGKIKADNLNGTHFSAKGRIIQVNIMNFTTQRDLLQFYLDLNAGGTPHSQQELDKVRAMLTEKQT